MTVDVSACAWGGAPNGVETLYMRVTALAEDRPSRRRRQFWRLARMLRADTHPPRAFYTDGLVFSTSTALTPAHVTAARRWGLIS